MPDAYRHNTSCVWDTFPMPPASVNAPWPNVLINRWCVNLGPCCVLREFTSATKSLSRMLPSRPSHAGVFTCRMLVARILRSGFNVLSLDDGEHSWLSATQQSVSALRCSGWRCAPTLRHHSLQMS